MEFAVLNSCVTDTNGNLRAASRVAERPRALRLAVVAVAEQTAAGQLRRPVPELAGEHVRRGHLRGSPAFARRCV